MKKGKYRHHWRKDLDMTVVEEEEEGEEEEREDVREEEEKITWAEEELEKTLCLASMNNGTCSLSQ